MSKKSHNTDISLGRKTCNPYIRTPSLHEEETLILHSSISLSAISAVTDAARPSKKNHAVYCEVVPVGEPQELGRRLSIVFT